MKEVTISTGFDEADLARGGRRSVVTMLLPYPPSVNRYYRKFRGRIVISPEGRFYRWAVLAARPSIGGPVPGPVKVTICIFPPTRFGIDIDNAGKAICDSLEDVKIVENDREIAELLIVRGPKKPTPCVWVMVETLPRWLEVG